MPIRMQDSPFFNADNWSDEARKRYSELYDAFMKKYGDEIRKMRDGDLAIFDTRDIIIPKSDEPSQ